MSLIKCGSLLTLVTTNVWKPLWLFLHNIKTNSGCIACMHVYFNAVNLTLGVCLNQKWKHIFVERLHGSMQISSHFYILQSATYLELTVSQQLTQHFCHFWAAEKSCKYIDNTFKLWCWTLSYLHMQQLHICCYLFEVFLVICNSNIHCV